MKVCIICIILSSLIFSVSAFGQSLNPEYQITYLMDINQKGIYINGTPSQTDAACIKENDIVFVPIRTFFSAAGFSTFSDDETQKFKADIDGTLFYVDGVNNQIGFGNFKYTPLIPPQFIGEECYVSFQDLLGLMDYDSVNGFIYMSVGSDFIEKIENHCKEMQKGEIYIFPVNESIIYRDNKPISFNEKIHIQNGYMMIPLRDTIQTLNPNAEIQWNEEKKMAQIQFNDKMLTFDTVNQKVYVNKYELHLKQNIETQNNHLFISLRDFANIVGLSDYLIYWDAERKTAYVRMAI